jgi:hypothetical protein
VKSLVVVVCLVITGVLPLAADEKDEIDRNTEQRLRIARAKSGATRL